MRALTPHSFQSKAPGWPRGVSEVKKQGKCLALQKAAAFWPSFETVLSKIPVLPPQKYVVTTIDLEGPDVVYLCSDNKFQRPKEGEGKMKRQSILVLMLLESVGLFSLLAKTQYRSRV